MVDLDFTAALAAKRANNVAGTEESTDTAVPVTKTKTSSKTTKRSAKKAIAAERTLITPATVKKKSR